MKDNLVLIGFMGSGKTTVGRKIAKILDMKFIDMDQLIEKKDGRAIKDIFEVDGEKYFRQLESEVAKECSEMNNVVVSTGGGVILNQENIKNLKKSSLIFYLDADANCIYQRVKHNKDRPLLNVEDPVKKIEELLNSRRELYEKSCDIKVKVSLRSYIDDLANEIKEIYIRTY